MCPCETKSRHPSYDFELWKQLDGLRPVTDSGSIGDFESRLRRATGYHEIEPTLENGGAVVTVRHSVSFGKGKLRELIVSYNRPVADVRALHAVNDASATDLLVLTPGSWTNSERMLGIWPEDYLRRIGGHYFDRGQDILAFDHGSDGTVEAIMNFRAMIEGGQIMGLWARSICDTISNLGLRDRYKRIWLYGLSRGGRVVEYTAALCPGFHFAVVGDLYVPDNYESFYWRGASATGNLKYGAWFGHLIPLIGHSTTADFMAAAKSPIVYTSAQKNFVDSRPQLEHSFVWRDGLAKVGALRLVFKTGIGHTPEIELLDKMLSDRWSEIRGVTLLRKGPPH